MISLTLEVFDEVDHFTVIIFCQAEFLPKFHSRLLAEEHLVFKTLELLNDLLIRVSLLFRVEPHLVLDFAQLSQILVSLLIRLVFVLTLLFLQTTHLIHEVLHHPLLLVKLLIQIVQERSSLWPT